MGSSCVLRVVCNSWLRVVFFFILGGRESDSDTGGNLG